MQKKLSPKIEGAIIIAKGAEDLNVKSNIIKAQLKDDNPLKRIWLTVIIGMVAILKMIRRQIQKVKH